jgi:hypothetical protein
MPSLTYIRGTVLFAGSANWAATDQEYGVLLAGEDYRPSRAHRFVSEVTGELTGGGYARQSLTGRAVLESDAADCVADAVTFSGLRTTQAYRWAIVFRKGKSDSASELICALDMDLVSLRAVTDHTIRWSRQAKAGRIFSLGSRDV